MVTTIFGYEQSKRDLPTFGKKRTQEIKYEDFYGITTHNEHEEIRKLLEFLVEHRDDGDEIVICDDHSDYQCWEVFDDFIHEQYPDIVFFERSLYNDFTKRI